MIKSVSIEKNVENLRYVSNKLLNIEWFIFFGTLLGYTREKNILKNDATYEKTYELLGKNDWIVIFPEGDCVQEKHLRPIKKGTARMAFGAMEKDGCKHQMVDQRYSQLNLKPQMH